MNNYKRHLGPVEQKIILLLKGGLLLGLSGNPAAYFRIIGGISKEWKAINRRSLYEAIRKLYISKLIDFKQNNDGSSTAIITEVGTRRVLSYDLEKISIQKPKQWDKFWRVVIFDIPENKKKGRNALAVKLKRMGFYPLQKSVFVHPYECKDEVDFIVEVFDLRKFVRLMLVKEIDNALHLKKIFELI